MRTRWLLPAACVGFAAVFAFPIAQADDDDHDDRGRRHRPGLIGTWRFTGFAPGFGTFYDYVVFHQDRTLTERVSFTQESVGSGVWKEIDSDDDDNSRSFAAMFETFRDDDSNGIVDFRTRARITLQLDGDTLTGTGTLELRSVAENELLVGPIPGATFVAERMMVIRE